MVLLVDIGNSNICMAFGKENKVYHNFRIKSYTNKSEDEYYLLIKEFIDESFNEVIISSVVPIVSSALIKMFKKYYHLEPLIVGNKLKTKVRLSVDDPKTVGADLVSDIAGGIDYFNEALIIDLGTASKFIYYKDKALVGVSIAPGLSVSMKSLTQCTAMLPHFELVTPSKIINSSTISCLQSGVIYGFACLVDGMVARIKKEVNNPNLKVIGTGGLFSLIAPICNEKIDIIDDLLTLKGIYNIYKTNKEAL